MALRVAAASLALRIAVGALLGSRRQEEIARRHVLITGGSEGIGLELAKLCAKRGARVSLIARTHSKLAVAEEEITLVAPGATVASFSADVSDRAALAKAVAAAEVAHGPLEICIAAAGASTPKYFEDLTDEDFMHMLRVNYLGVVNLAKEALPGMAARDAGGHFCAVSSLVASVPFVGYAAYAPSKAACRALMDVLRNEFADTSLQFHVAFPPDTETPGFAVENETKPWETSHVWPEIFNEVFPASTVAGLLLDDLLAGEYFLRSPDVFGNLLATRGWGPFPRSASKHTLEAVVAPVFVGVHALMVWMMDRALRLRSHHRQLAGTHPKARL